jgi:RNA polymerase sigma-70 factor (ECF subfamily)
VTTHADPGFERQLETLRPKLHRYCARMTGSAIDGEDVLQDALIKALAALRDGPPVANIEGWLFRIAHNTALDFLRRRARAEERRAEADLELLGESDERVDDPEIVAASLRTFMRLPAPQRSSVILMDVLGYPLREICGIMDASLPAVKSALHRGRARLRELAREPVDRLAPQLDPAERSRLTAYVERFNARDFDAIRELLAEDVRLDLVNRAQRNGRREVAEYFGNYAEAPAWRCTAGMVDERPAVLFYDLAVSPDRPAYFALLGWRDGRLREIRDFRYARYAIDEAEVATIAQR